MKANQNYMHFNVHVLTNVIFGLGIAHFNGKQTKELNFQFNSNEIVDFLYLIFQRKMCIVVECSSP